MIAPTRRAAIAALAGAGVSLGFPAAVKAAGSTTDPTFALIEQHRAAWGRFDAIVGQHSDTLDQPPPEFEAKYDAAAGLEDAMLEALLTPEPTTLAGLRALAEYMAAHDIKLNGPIYSDTPARWALASIAETCRRLIPDGGA